MARAPHYLRFARTLAFVSAALPVPVVALVSACSDSSTGTTYGPANGVGPAPGTAPAPGVMMGPPTGVAPGEAGPGDAHEDVADGSDANDDGGGGPARGTPELPVSWLA